MPAVLLLVMAGTCMSHEHNTSFHMMIYDNYFSAKMSVLNQLPAL